VASANIYFAKTPGIVLDSPARQILSLLSGRLAALPLSFFFPIRGISLLQFGIQHVFAHGQNLLKSGPNFSF
jgi:hypothetical protein